MFRTISPIEDPTQQRPVPRTWLRAGVQWLFTAIAVLVTVLQVSGVNMPAETLWGGIMLLALVVIR